MSQSPQSVPLPRSSSEPRFDASERSEQLAPSLPPLGKAQTLSPLSSRVRPRGLAMQSYR